MNIPSEAVEAAAMSLFEDSPTSRSTRKWSAHFGDQDKAQFRAEAKRALEAAAPYIKSQALEEAADAIEPSRFPYLDGQIDMNNSWRLWLRSRADALRNGRDVEAGMDQTEPEE